MDPRQRGSKPGTYILPASNRVIHFEKGMEISVLRDKVDALMFGVPSVNSFPDLDGNIFGLNADTKAYAERLGAQMSYAADGVQQLMKEWEYHHNCCCGDYW